MLKILYKMAKQRCCTNYVRPSHVVVEKDNDKLPKGGYEFKISTSVNLDVA